MKILKLHVSNFKRIVVADITPDGHIVEIAGKNAQGKTSIMDAIAVLLGGKALIPPDPVHTGADRSELQADLGDYVVRRTITPERKGTISITNKEGMRAAEPQKVLDDLVGHLMFDPLLFVRQKPAEQMATLQSFAPEGTDFESFDAIEKEAYAERTNVNREVKRLQTLVDEAIGIEEVPEEEDTSALLDAIEKANARNEDIRAKQAKRDAAQRTVDECNKGIADAVEEIEALQQRIVDEQARIDAFTAKRDPLVAALGKAKALPALEDVSELTEQLRTAQAAASGRAAAVARAEQAKADKVRLERAKADSAKLTAEIEKAQADREAAIAAIDLPVKGLTVTAEGILFNGHPLSQASFAQQLQLGIALAMKANPKLKIAIVKEASMLDEDARAMLAKMAAKEDFQVWIETVGKGGEDAIVIEEGEVKSAPKRKAK